MKIKEKIVVKKNGEIVATIGEDLTVLAIDKETKNLVEYIIKKDVMSSTLKRDSIESTSRKPQTEMEFYMGVMQESIKHGLDIE